MDRKTARKYVQAGKLPSERGGMGIVQSPSK
jgi:hypothetical protein